MRRVSCTGEGGTTGTASCSFPSLSSRPHRHVAPPLQIETTSGDVTVQATQFAGIVSVVTAGTVACSGGGFPAPCATVSENSLNVVEQVRAPSPPSLCGRPSSRFLCDLHALPSLTACGLPAGLLPSHWPQVYVNCAPSTCPYYAQLSVTTQTGNVALQMDAWAPPA